MTATTDESSSNVSPKRPRILLVLAVISLISLIVAFATGLIGPPTPILINPDTAFSLLDVKKPETAPELQVYFRALNEKRIVSESIIDGCIYVQTPEDSEVLPVPGDYAYVVTLKTPGDTYQYTIQNRQRINVAGVTIRTNIVCGHFHK